MIEKVFIDTDIILDVALARKDFVDNSRLILALAENYIIQGVTSSTNINNIHYILRKSGGDINARLFIRNLLKYIIVLSVDQNDIENALDSDFSDFEDAVQNSVASRNYCDMIVTRNIDDYKRSKIRINMPIEVIKIYQERLY